jgi:hypothetical protein
MDIEVPPAYKAHVRKMLPTLQEGVQYTYRSPIDYNYNCLSWSLSVDNLVFEDAKGAFWPWKEIPDDTADGWARVLQLHGFEIASDPDFVSGYEKVAILETEEGDLHATRSDQFGVWKSKLGDMGPDIDHIDLISIEPMYGSVVRLLQRRRRDWEMEAE